MECHSLYRDKYGRGGWVELGKVGYRWVDQAKYGYSRKKVTLNRVSGNTLFILIIILINKIYSHGSEKTIHRRDFRFAPFFSAYSCADEVYFIFCRMRG